MLPAVVVFFIATGAVLGAFAGWGRLSSMLERRRLESRLRDVAQTTTVEEKSSVIKQQQDGRLPAVERVLGLTPAGASLGKLIEQSGVVTTPGAILVWSLGCAALLALIAGRFLHIPFAQAIGAIAGVSLPTFWLRRMRTVRIRRFEEQFPEALDLLSRAMRAGHAFQTALGTAADELSAPVGIELRKVFDQQNFGLPLNDALKELAERIPLVDVKFFVTAIAIQRESGGNLAEILDNLAHVVRERFKVQRQVRTHTAHGRFTGFVLLALPAALAVGLSVVAPAQMDLLFKESMGKMMIGAAIIMQTVGFFWIRQVVKIEV